MSIGWFEVSLAYTVKKKSEGEEDTPHPLTIFGSFNTGDQFKWLFYFLDSD